MQMTGWNFCWKSLEKWKGKLSPLRRPTRSHKCIRRYSAQYGLMWFLRLFLSKGEGKNRLTLIAKLSLQQLKRRSGIIAVRFSLLLHLGFTWFRIDPMLVITSCRNFSQTDTAAFGPSGRIFTSADPTPAPVNPKDDDDDALLLLTPWLPLLKTWLRLLPGEVDRLDDEAPNLRSLRFPLWPLSLPLSLKLSVSEESVKETFFVNEGGMSYNMLADPVRSPSDNKDTTDLEDAMEAEEEEAPNPPEIPLCVLGFGGGTAQLLLGTS